MTRLARPARCLAVLLAVALVSLFAAGPAAAHARLLSTVPVGGGAIAAAPSSVALTFDEAPVVQYTVVHVTGPDGKRIDTGAAQLKGSVITERVANATTPGQYIVDWRAVSDDGHTVSGSFSFSLSRTTSGAPSAAVATASHTASPSASASPSKSALPGLAGVPTRPAKSQSPPVAGIVAIIALLVAALFFAIYALRRRRPSLQK